MVTAEKPPNTPTVLEVAATHGVHPETVRRWVREGRIPARKVGNTFFIPPYALETMRKESKDARQ